MPKLPPPRLHVVVGNQCATGELVNSSWTCRERESFTSSVPVSNTLRSEEPPLPKSLQLVFALPSSSSSSMWQAVFAAAVAASTGLLAKNHIFNFKPATDSDPTTDHNAEPHPNPNPNLSIASAFQSELPPWEISDCEEQPEGTIFRFSSEGRGESGTRFRLRRGARSKKKKGVGVEDERSNGAEQRRTARKVGVCLKKRKTGKSVAAAKCGSSSSAG